MTVNVDRSQQITVTAYFPSIDFSTELNVQRQSRTVSLDIVKDLLFELTEKEVLSSNQFQNYFEKLSEPRNKYDLDALIMIQQELKAYGRKA